jgi:hypothetical protein
MHPIGSRVYLCQRDEGRTVGSTRKGGKCDSRAGCLPGGGNPTRFNNPTIHPANKTTIPKRAGAPDIEPGQVLTT